MEPKTPRESRAERTALNLAKMERAWKGKAVGIGFDCDTETGRIVVKFGPVDHPALTITITADIDSISVGEGDEN